jgi:type IV pilus assembly protein PilV
MNKMTKHIQKTNNRGFSLLEVLLGITIFMIGMLGVTALNISSLKSNTFSGNLSEAAIIAASKIEELMNQDFDDPASQLFDVDDDGSNATDQDVDDDGMDDDDPDDTDAANVDNKPNFGLDDVGADADYNDQVINENNMIYNVYWNVAENEPITTTPQRTKRITVIVEWFVKDQPRRISMFFQPARFCDQRGPAYPDPDFPHRHRFKQHQHHGH